MQIKHIENELVSVKEENAHITKENKSLNQTISELKITVIKLESTKNQLEFDQCNLKAALDKMNHDYHQVNDSFKYGLNKVLLLLFVMLLVTERPNGSQRKCNERENCQTCFRNQE